MYDNRIINYLSGAGTDTSAFGGGGPELRGSSAGQKDRLANVPTKFQVSSCTNNLEQIGSIPVNLDKVCFGYFRNNS